MQEKRHGGTGEYVVIVGEQGRDVCFPRIPQKPERLKLALVSAKFSGMYRLMGRSLKPQPPSWSYPTSRDEPDCGHRQRRAVAEYGVSVPYQYEAGSKTVLW